MSQNPDTLLTRFYRLGSPPSFYGLAGVLMPFIGFICIALFAAGIYGGLVLAPADYQQGESYRIIYIHVPSAFPDIHTQRET